jgi:hypothetical protein
VTERESLARQVEEFSNMIADAERERAKAQARLAELDAPDPLLIEAREIAGKTLYRLGASAEMIAAGDITSGLKDDAIIVHACLAALRRGMELAKAPPMGSETIPYASLLDAEQRCLAAEIEVERLKKLLPPMGSAMTEAEIETELKNLALWWSETKTRVQPRRPSEGDTK